MNIEVENTERDGGLTCEVIERIKDLNLALYGILHTDNVLFLII